MFRYFTKLFNSLHFFVKRDEGTAAIEFALIAPIMIFTFIGTVEISHAWLTKEKVEAATETIADLVAQGTQVTEADLDQIFSLTSATLNNAEEATIDVEVTALRTEPDSGGNPVTKVIWRRTKSGPPQRQCDDVYTSLPPGLAVNYETLILTELKFSYNRITSSKLTFVGNLGLDFGRAYINRPRYTSDIPCEENGNSCGCG